MEPGANSIREGKRMVHVPVLQDPVRGLPILVADGQMLSARSPLLSFRAKRGISHRFKPEKREIPRRAARLGMTNILVFPQAAKPDPSTVSSTPKADQIGPAGLQLPILRCRRQFH